MTWNAEAGPKAGLSSGPWLDVRLPQPEVNEAAGAWHLLKPGLRLSFVMLYFVFLIKCLVLLRFFVFDNE